MNIFALSVTLNLNYFALKARQTKTPLAPAVIMVLNEYSPHSLPSPKAVKAHPPRLAEVLLAAHAQPQVVLPAKCNSSGGKLQKFQRISKYTTKLVSGDD